MNGLLDVIKSMGPARLGAMGAVALGLVAFFAFMIMRFNEVQMAPLYTGLSFEDSSAVVKELDSLNIPYELREDGKTILVADADVLKLRMQLAESGLPTGGGVGYEIFDKSDALGTTSFVQNVNHLRALEGELGRTIRALDRVEQARVHLVLPERQLFKKDAEKPTASVVLKTRGQLETAQIRAIQHLVASAVPGLQPSRISIIDETGRLLASGEDGTDQGLFASNLDERTTSYQNRMENKIEEIVASVVGPGRARVKVSAELDFNRVTQTEDHFDPDGQVVRSSQNREENSSTVNPNGEVTVGNQVPNGGNANNGQSPTDQTSKTEEVVNYEISKTSRTEVVEAGGLKRLSVAVLVDGSYAPDANGNMAYSPRTQDELDRISALVRTAMGYSQDRGDQIEVVNLRFAEGPPSLPVDGTAPGMFDFDKSDVMRLAELGVMGVMTLLVLLFAVRPLVKRILSPERITEHVSITNQSATMVDENGNIVPLVEGPGGDLTAIEAQLEVSRIDEAQAQGEAQMVEIKKVGKLVDENPIEASIIIRNWLLEAA